MRVSIEGHTEEIPVPAEGVSLGQLVDEVEAFLHSVGKLGVGLSVNGAPLTQDELEKRLEEPLTGEEDVEFQVTSFGEFIIDNLEGTKDANSRLLESLRQFAKDIHAADKQLDPGGMVEDLAQFFEFWVRLGGMIPTLFEEVSCGQKPIGEVLGGLRDLLEEVVSALENDDLVLGADLVEYEIVPVVEGITVVVPQLVDRIRELESSETSHSE